MLPAVATPERDDRGLARQHGEDGVECRKQKGDEIREHRFGLEVG